ncbi:serine/threonine protein kinase [Myxococcus fulvus]|uniref:serine/threonine-protein kinase n=1 Tax=Myxococcus fulvus TaxID=33 RepID=UPI00200B52B6|nr:serine/threonine protein kinase [Myxococcus fulvus]MCK8499776.1 protein kinase [Myxococcus fulvus]
MTTGHPLALRPGMKVGPWRVRARLGQGAFGAVFQVEQGGRLHALKFALRGPGSEDLDRTDARAVRELACLLHAVHPHVVRVWAHGRWPDVRTGYHYVVLDYVEGATLATWVKREAPSARRVARLFSQLAWTLGELHSRHVFHRDLKPSNILVRASDESPVLVDFGSANHAESQPLTEGPLPPGTPQYRSPEALRFHREHHAQRAARYAFRATDDLYALGVSLHEMLTGAPAFSLTLPREVLSEHIETRMPAPASSLNARVPSELDAITQRLLRKKPEERFQEGGSLHAALEAALRSATPEWDRPLFPRTPSPSASEATRRKVSPDDASESPWPVRLARRHLRHATSSGGSRVDLGSEAPQTHERIVDPLEGAHLQARTSSAGPHPHEYIVDPHEGAHLQAGASSAGALPHEHSVDSHEGAHLQARTSSAEALPHEHSVDSHEAVHPHARPPAENAHPHERGEEPHDATRLHSRPPSENAHSHERGEEPHGAARRPARTPSEGAHSHERGAEPRAGGRPRPRTPSEGTFGHTADPHEAARRRTRTPSEGAYSHPRPSSEARRAHPRSTPPRGTRALPRRITPTEEALALAWLRRVDPAHWSRARKLWVAGTWLGLLFLFGGTFAALRCTLESALESAAHPGASLQSPRPERIRDRRP